MAGTQRPPSVRECFQLLLGHWKKILGFSAVTMALAMGIIVAYPKAYVSEAKLYVRMGRENVTLDPTVTTAQTIMVQRTQENEINSLLDILGSRWMAEQVVNTVGVDRMLSNGTSQPAAATASTAGSTSLSSSWVDRAVAAVSYPVSARDQAIKKVRQSMEVRAPKESTVITISTKAGSPELAQEITAATVDAFLDAHLRLNHTRGTHEFFAEQSEILRNKLAQVSRELCDRKNQFGMLSIGGRRDALEDQISSVQLQVRSTERRLAASRAQARALQEQLALASPNVTATLEGVAHGGWDRMRERLYELQLAELELTTKCTAEFPKVATIAKRRKEAQDILKKQTPQRTQVTTGPNPTHQSLQLELSRQLAQVASLQSSHELLAKQVVDLSEELKTVNSQEFQINELERHVAILEASYRKHSEKLEEARIDNALQSQRISSLNVVQPATFESKPVSPKRGTTLFSAMVVAGFGGLVIVVLSEYSKPRFHRCEQAESAPESPQAASSSKRQTEP